MSSYPTKQDFQSQFALKGKKKRITWLQAFRLLKKIALKRYRIRHFSDLGYQAKEITINSIENVEQGISIYRQNKSKKRVILTTHNPTTTVELNTFQIEYELDDEKLAETIISNIVEEIRSRTNSSSRGSVSTVSSPLRQHRSTPQNLYSTLSAKSLSFSSYKTNLTITNNHENQDLNKRVKKVTQNDQPKERDKTLISFTSFKKKTNELENNANFGLVIQNANKISQEQAPKLILAQPKTITKSNKGEQVINQKPKNTVFNTTKNIPNESNSEKKVQRPLISVDKENFKSSLENIENKTEVNKIVQIRLPTEADQIVEVPREKRSKKNEAQVIFTHKPIESKPLQRDKSLDDKKNQKEKANQEKTIKNITVREELNQNQEPVIKNEKHKEKTDISSDIKQINEKKLEKTFPSIKMPSNQTQVIDKATISTDKNANDFKSQKEIEPILKEKIHKIAVNRPKLSLIKEQKFNKTIKKPFKALTTEKPVPSYDKLPQFASNKTKIEKEELLESVNTFIETVSGSSIRDSASNASDNENDVQEFTQDEIDKKELIYKVSLENIFDDNSNNDINKDIMKYNELDQENENFQENISSHAEPSIKENKDSVDLDIFFNKTDDQNDHKFQKIEENVDETAEEYPVLDEDEITVTNYEMDQIIEDSNLPLDESETDNINRLEKTINGEADNQKEPQKLDQVLNENDFSLPESEFLKPVIQIEINQNNLIDNDHLIESETTISNHEKQIDGEIEQSDLENTYNEDDTISNGAKELDTDDTIDENSNQSREIKPTLIPQIKSLSENDDDNNDEDKIPENYFDFDSASRFLSHYRKKPLTKNPRRDSSTPVLFRQNYDNYDYASSKNSDDDSKITSSWNKSSQKLKSF